VIRDVGGSYRRALAATVHHYSGWCPDAATIDSLKAEGRWNNDWQASLELLRRREHCPLPPFEALVEVFSGFYFGGDPAGDPAQWQGFIGEEPLLVDPGLFDELDAAGIVWGFVSGAEPPSARFVLEQRLGLNAPPLIAMGDAPDKPDPTGLLQLASRLIERHGSPELGAGAPPIVYLGDTVADVITVQQARQQQPRQTFLSLAVAPPHLHTPEAAERRHHYEAQLIKAGADAVIPSTTAVLAELSQILSR
jgi:HAD superfamily phosphatase